MTKEPPDGQKHAERPDPGHATWAAFLLAHTMLIGRVEERLAKAGLPELAWYDVLWALESAPGQRLRMHELAAATIVSRSNLTRLVDRLAAAGLVERDRDCEDRRGAYAVLTRAGVAMRRRMWPVYDRAIAELFDRHFDAGRAAEMRELLVRIVEAARR